LIIDDNQTIHDAFDGIFAPDVSTSKLEAAEAVLYGLDRKPVRLKPSYDIDHALSGLDGVEKVRAARAAGRPYQLTFVDVRMPGIDGIETIQRIWQLDAQIQTVICTAYSDYRWEQLAERLGQTDRLLVLKKPFHDVEVLQMASAMVEKWYLARQVAMKTEQMELLIARRTQKLLALQQPETPAPPVSPSAELPGNEEAELERDQPLLLCLGDRELALGTLVQPLAEAFRLNTKAIGSGWQEARESVPDLIILQPTEADPKAFDLCRQIKADELVGHIPIIMLLPDSAERTQMRALEVGADDCLLPPWRLAMLRARLDNLLASRRKWQEYFRSARTFQPQELATNHADAQFLRRVVDIVQANLSDYEFDVETLARKLAVSRRQLFRKFKAIANTTPNAFIRDIRLKRAAHLLGTSNLTVSEIIHAVGFSDPKYFRTVFKEQFGVLPGEFTKPS